MTNVTLFWSEEAGTTEKSLIGLESRGHSGGGCKGNDVVCAAVSTLVHALYLGLADAAKIPVERQADASAPFISLKWPKEAAPQVRLLTETVVLSLKEIALRYAEHVSISEVYLS